VVAKGSLEAHTLTGADAGNATLTSNGATVEATRLTVTCRYKTENTDVGRITGSANRSGQTATFHIEGKIPFHSGSGLCGENPTTWTGSYLVNTPMTLDFA